MYGSEFDTIPVRILVHDPVAAGAFNAMNGLQDKRALERDWLFRDPPQDILYAQQHRAFVDMLRRYVEVTYLVDLVGDDDSYVSARTNPNQVFTRDSLITLPWIPDGYLTGRMKCSLRRSESQTMRAAVEQLGLHAISTIPDGLFLEGGDVIPFRREGRRTLLVGHGPRTCFEAVEFLQSALIPEHADELVAVELAEWRMNLDGGLVPVAEDVLLVDPPSILRGVLLDSCGRKSLDVLGLFRDLGMRIIETTCEESVYSQACNCVCIDNRTVVYYDLCERVCDLLRRNDVETLCVPGSELVKGRGGPRCMTRPIYR